MKDTSSFFCNLDYLLVPIKLSDLYSIIKKGVQPDKRAACIEAQPLLHCKERGVYAVAIFRQWKNRQMKDLEIHNIDPESELVLKIDKSAVLYSPFHFNKCEHVGQQNLNTLVSYDDSPYAIWRYDAVHNLKDLMYNELIFHTVLDPAFINEIWYFTKNAPPDKLYNKHYKARFIENSIKVLL